MEKKVRQKIEFRPRMRTWVGRIKFWDEQARDWARTPVTDLGTDDPVEAQARYDRWLESGVLPTNAAGAEPFKDAAERFLADKATARDRLGRDGRDVRERRHRLETFAYPIIGHIRVMDLGSEHVSAVLDSMMRQGYPGLTQLKVRSDLSRVCSSLARSGAMRVNVARGVELHEDAVDDARERMVLSPEHEVEFMRQRGFGTELDMLYLHSRCVHGGRTSCLHASRWEHWDLESFATVQVRRPKTDADARGRTSGSRRVRERGGKKRAGRRYELITHRVESEVVREATRAWWVSQGSPTTGPVFPVQRGPRAGEHKRSGTSYAEAFRKAVWGCRLHHPKPGFHEAVGEAARKALDRYQTDDEETRALDFHGVRASTITAMLMAGATDTQIQDAVGHTDIRTSRGYLRERTASVPLGAQPTAGLPPVPAPPAPVPAPPAAPRPAPSVFGSVADLLASLADEEAPEGAGRGAAGLAKNVGQAPSKRDL